MAETKEETSSLILREIGFAEISFTVLDDAEKFLETSGNFERP